MPYVEGGYVNPFYRPIDEEVKAELEMRGKFYGAKVRSDSSNSRAWPRGLAWSYQKVAWVVISSTDFQNAPKLGSAYSRVMSDSKGNLTLYDSTRNQPKYPLLQSLELSNEGTIGSLLKGKFNFIVFPDLTEKGFQFESLEEAYFKPGREVDIRWGWSVWADNKHACMGSMRGIIFNFNWAVNGDLSITADCSIVSKATVSLGVTGEHSNPNTDSDTKDEKGQVIPDSDLIGIIDSDLKELGNGSTSMSSGAMKFFGRDKTKSGAKFVSNKNSFGLQYFAIGVPTAESEPEKDKQAPKVIVKPIYYIKLGDLMELINGMMRKSEEVVAQAQGQTNSNEPPVVTSSGLSDLFYIVCNGNETQYNVDLVSCTPDKVLFPDDFMCKYGTFSPFAKNPIFRKGVDGSDLEGDVVNIGNILISTDLVKEVFSKFVDENQTKIEMKNITNFVNDIISPINYASGEFYQLTSKLIEPEEAAAMMNGISKLVDREKKKGNKALLSIEDSNLAAKATANIVPYNFNSSISKPLIKNISITSKPPGPMAAASFAEARGKKDNGQKLGPSQTDVRTAQNKDIDVDKYKKEFEDASKILKETLDSFVKDGASSAFANKMKAAYSKYKKSATNVSKGAHWLNRAIYPIELTLTIDGINGLKFGDVFKTNLIPSVYNDDDVDMVFVITKINHSIKDGIWETVLSTKSRISMGS
jgi:hypothetical protein